MRRPRGAQALRRIALGVAFMAAMTVLVIVLTRNVLPLLFLGWEAADPQTVALAATLLLLGASFFIADGTQTVAAGALRGLNDTRVPLAVRGGEFLARRLHRVLGVRIYAWAWRPTASGSACRSGSRSTRCCWCCASIGSPRGIIFRLSPEAPPA